MKFLKKNDGELNNEFIEKYVEYLSQYSQINFLDDFLKIHSNELSNYNNSIYKDNSRTDKINWVGAGYFIYDEDYLFRNNINFISGYDNNYRFTNFFGWGFEYELPLFYPDFSIGPIAYIQRIRGTGFINGGTIEGNLNNGGTTFTESPKSAGVGITLDLNLFRQTFMFDLGVKYSYVFGISDFEKGPSIEITLGSITF